MGFHAKLGLVGVLEQEKHVTALSAKPADQQSPYSCITRSELRTLLRFSLCPGVSSYCEFRRVMWWNPGPRFPAPEAISMYSPREEESVCAVIYLVSEQRSDVVEQFELLRECVPALL